MINATIRLSVQKTIDSSSKSKWEKTVFEDSYVEFQMKAQFYNPTKEFTTFKEIINNDARAEKLHFLVSAAIVPYLSQLNNIIYDVKNTLGESFIGFENFNFKIIDSHISNKSFHKLTVTLLSEEITWVDTFDNKLLIALGNVTEKINKGEKVDTHLVLLPENTSINSFRLSYKLLQ